MKDCLLDINTKRTDWILKYPGAIILAANMIRWTLSAECSIFNTTSDNASKKTDSLGLTFNNLK